MNIDHLARPAAFHYQGNVSITNKLPQIPLRRYLWISPSYHTLSNAVDVSRKTPYTSNPLSKPLKTSWVIAINWLMQESPGLKTVWLEEIRLLSEKYVNIEL